MKKLLLWEKVQAAINEIEQRLRSQDVTDEARCLENKKQLFLAELFLLIQHIGKSTEKSSLKFEAWINRGKNREETAEKLGMTTDSLRATIWYFNNRLENIVGEDTVTKIVNCKSQQELGEIKKWFWTRVSSLSKGYFR
ncbi:hypothetical protein ABEV09_07235 [Schinkia azotoformans]|uniref:hypothetical protein n=1 Tax=Schinkia azotoformans TaxID=1454 RepID=UPI002DBB2B29|nr:hypothetical protein [Schinkia azotoformans]MEC1717224.1 hypothetical protein [Schinkia azotoformans]